METQVWKVTINLRKKGEPYVTVAARGVDGTVIRSGGPITDKKSAAVVVEEAFEAFKSYDPALHQRAHDLAVAAAKSQQDRQEGSEEK